MRILSRALILHHSSRNVAAMSPLRLLCVVLLCAGLGSAVSSERKYSDCEKTCAKTRADRVRCSINT